MTFYNVPTIQIKVPQLGHLFIKDSVGPMVSLTLQ